MEKRVGDLEMRTSTLEQNMALLTQEVGQVTTSMKTLSDSVSKLVITLDRGKWLGYGILIMAGAQIMGFKELLKVLVGF